MVLSRKAFVDTSVFLAFVDRANINHQKSVAMFEFLARNHNQVFTSNLVIFQVFNKLNQDVGISLSYEFLKTILQSNIDVLYPARSELVAAFRFFKNSPQRNIALTEVVNASLIEKHNIGSILTFDWWPNILGIKISPLLNL